MPSINDDPTALALDTVSTNGKHIVKLVNSIKQWLRSDRPLPIPTGANTAVMATCNGVVANTGFSNYTATVNVNSGFNATTGVFTAPFTGVYHIQYTVTFVGAAANSLVTIQPTVIGTGVNNSGSYGTLTDVHYNYSQITTLNAGSTFTPNVTLSSAVATKSITLTIQQL